MKALFQTSAGLLCFSLATLCVQAATHTNIHREVQTAINWEFPLNECELPTQKRSSDPTTAQRLLTKATKKWQRCYASYEELLRREQARLTSVASHGLTMAQAEIILGHLYKIRLTLNTDNPTNKNTKPSFTGREEDFLQPLLRH